MTFEPKVYLGNFSGWGADDYGTIVYHYQIENSPEPELVYAVYATPAYEGHAFVAFKQDGKWFYTHGGHCSCYGLEGQWEPVEFDPKLHFEAKEAGKVMIETCSTQGEVPEATQEHFDEWLRQASKYRRKQTVNDIGDDVLLGRAVKNARSREKNKGVNHYRWVAVMDTFDMGSGYAKQLCVRFGLDPDEMVKR